MTQFTTSQFTSQEKCQPADNLTLAIVNCRYKIRDNIINIVILVKQCTASKSAILFHGTHRPSAEPIRRLKFQSKT